MRGVGHTVGATCCATHYQCNRLSAKSILTLQVQLIVAGLGSLCHKGSQTAPLCMQDWRRCSHRPRAQTPATDPATDPGGTLLVAAAPKLLLLAHPLRAFDRARSFSHNSPQQRDSCTSVQHTSLVSSPWLPFLLLRYGGLHNDFHQE